MVAAVSAGSAILKDTRIMSNYLNRGEILRKLPAIQIELDRAWRHMDLYMSGQYPDSKRMAEEAMRNAKVDLAWLINSE